MPTPSPAWRLAFKVLYAVLRVLDPFIRVWWGAFGIGITAELAVRGRRSGRERSVLVGLLNVDRQHYVGHPNGAAAWTRDLEAAREARVAQLPGQWTALRAVQLPEGPERDAVIAATAHQQPFPGSLIYRAAQRHIRAVGIYFRLQPANIGADAASR